MAQTEDWQLVAEWLMRMRVLSKNGAQISSFTTEAEFGGSLRDGVCLCRLLTILNPNSLTVNEYNPFPHDSEYMASRNIVKFLSVCKHFFKLSDENLFEVDDILHLANFGKVLRSLVLLSRSPFVLTGPSTALHLNGDDKVPQEDQPSTDSIDDLEFDDANEYVNLLDYESETSARIYESVVQRAEPGRKRPNSALESVLADPKTKHEHCLRELIEKEANYVQVLGMLHTNFMMPLRDKLRPEVRDVIFKYIEDLYRFHERLLSALNDAVLKNEDVSVVFLRYRMSFALYGAYCANLPIAQAKIVEACRDPAIASEINKCEMLDTDRFKLGELLTVPMQRVLKYPLMLRELLKCRVKNETANANASPGAADGSATCRVRDRHAFDEAIDAMQDVATFINECKRDAEIAHSVEVISRSIDGLPKAAAGVLIEFGRICKDGELRVAMSNQAKSAARFVFLFETCLIICKRKRTGDRFFGGQTSGFKFKEIISLEKYKLVQTSGFESPKRGRTKVGDKRTAQPFNLEPNIVSKSLPSFAMVAKNDIERESWTRKLLDCFEKLSPAAAAAHGRQFVYTTFTEPTLCHVCYKLLRGAIYQGYRCTRSNVEAHRECVAELAEKPFFDPPAPSLLVSAAYVTNDPRRRASLPQLIAATAVVNPASMNCSTGNAAIIRSKIDDVLKAVVRQAYNGNPLPPGSREPLGFQESENVEITLMPLDSDWCEGRINDRKGWFPRDCVDIQSLAENERNVVYSEQAMASLESFRKLYQSQKLCVNAAANNGNSIGTPSSGADRNSCMSSHGTCKHRVKSSIQTSSIVNARANANSNAANSNCSGRISVPLLNTTISRQSRDSGRPSTDCEPSSATRISNGFEHSGLFLVLLELQAHGDTWFVGPMDRAEAETRLGDSATGTFLVRQRANAPSEFALSVRYRETVKHMLIYRSESDRTTRWFLCDQRRFESIPELVAFYEMNALSNAFSDVDCALSSPVLSQQSRSRPQSDLQTPSPSIDSTSSAKSDATQESNATMMSESNAEESTRVS